MLVKPVGLRHAASAGLRRRFDRYGFDRCRLRAGCKRGDDRGRTVLIPHGGTGRRDCRHDTGEVAERIGRGDCDYWLTTAKDSKVNVGVFTGAEATSYFEQTKGIGTPEVVNVGDEAYSIFNESIGTVVVARKGDAVVAVQVFAGAGTDQLRQATSLVEAILAASLAP